MENNTTHIERLKELGLSFIENKLTTNGLSPKEKLINKIDDEINIINQRNDLELKKRIKNVKNKDGEIKERSVNEIRFWKKLKNEQYQFGFNIKYKGKIVKFTDKDKIIGFDTKDELVDKLTICRTYISGLNDGDIVFKQIDSKETESETLVNDNIIKSDFNSKVDNMFDE